MKLSRGAVVGALLAALGTAWIGGAPASAAGDEAAAIARGGRLYDDWAKEIGSDSLRRAVRSQEVTTRPPGRCIDCHGWDYRGKDGTGPRIGMTGLVGGIAGRFGTDVGEISKILGDATHRYGDFLAADDIADLALFVAKGQIVMDDAIEPTTLRAKGWAPNGNVYFQTICANCHGNDGQALVDARPLGDVARENPWQSMHTLLNGHPNGTMPALRVLDRATLVDILAYIQALPPRDLLASIVRGGRLYDTWYKENGREVPEGIHPAYSGTPPKGVEPRTTWRCKECHGWDYRGKAGAAAAAEQKPATKGIEGMAWADAGRIMARFSDPLHGYAKLLSPRDRLDLANFVSRGQLDMDEYIDRTTRRSRGQAERFTSHYHTICAPCHGADGREIRSMPPLGRIAAQDPWRALHGILNGHPGEPMPPLMALPREAASGILSYIQTLPSQR
ncbi:c-type cytochrome [Pinisolibacter sp.]|uniref:c-type cytochrome n=1 Tax=Pinisolibacter sp. TaxID=2172024 RepID=UPI002FDD9818